MDTAPYVEVRVAQRFSTSSDRVFNAWIDPAIAGRWLFATASRPMSQVRIDARAGGSFRFENRQDGEYDAQSGKYVEIACPRRLVFTLDMENPSHVVTRVTVDIIPLEKGCELTLAHAGVPLSHARHTENRWTGMLYGLGVTLGTKNP